MTFYKPLALDDLNVGMFVTIEGGDDIIRQVMGDEVVVGEYMGCLKGDPLKILAVCLPYVVVKVLNNPLAPPVSIDIRQCDFMQIGRDYVAAMVSHIGKLIPVDQGPPVFSTARIAE